MVAMASRMDSHRLERVPGVMPARRPAMLRSWQGEPPLMMSTGSTRSGTAYALPTSEPATDDGECSSWRGLPTPTTQDAANSGGQPQFARNTPPLNAVVRMLGESVGRDLI